MTDAQPIPWRGFGYAPVRGLVDRHVARFLRTQRKNMRRFFHERNQMDLFAQLDELRKDPSLNFREKNEVFQRVLNEHIARSAPPATAEAPDKTAVPVVDTDTAAAVAVPGSPGGADGRGVYAGRSVPGLAEPDAGGGPVIEE